MQIGSQKMQNAISKQIQQKNRPEEIQYLLSALKLKSGTIINKIENAAKVKSKVSKANNNCSNSPKPRTVHPHTLDTKHKATQQSNTDQ